MNLSYFEAIDLIKSKDQVELLTSGSVHLSPFTNIDQYNLGGLQPLHYAIQTKNHLAIDWLLSHENVRVDAVTEIESWNSAHCAVKAGDSKTLEKLVKVGVNLNAIDTNNLTPLAYAESDLGAEKWLEYLEINSINFKTQLGPNKRTYFHYFAKDSTKSLLDYVIKMDIDNINKADISGTTPLMLAAEAGEFEALWKLLSNGAKYDILDGEGRSALQRAAAAGQTKACQILLYDPNVLPSDQVNDNEEYYTEVYDAPIERIKAQALLFIQDKQDLTPLMAAVLNGHTETVRILAKENSNHLDLKQEQSGDTALHLAVSINSTEIVSILLDSGAYPDPLNKSGKKPSDLAQDDSEIFDLFIDPV